MAANADRTTGRSSFWNPMIGGAAVSGSRTTSCSRRSDGHADRAGFGIAIGRKAWLFAGSERGGERRRQC